MIRYLLMSPKRKIIIVAHNLRSIHNVGSILRTADGLGAHRVFLSGYTPYPIHPGDIRLPHLAAKIHKQIQKTALGAETSVNWQYFSDITSVFVKLKSEGYKIYALEQAANSIKLNDYKPEDKLALIVGREVEGLESEVIKNCDGVIEIPMFGAKESFNVAQAAAIGLYHCTFM